MSLFKKKKITINSSIFDLRDYTADAMSNIKQINSSFLILPEKPDEDFISALTNIKINSSCQIKLSKEAGIITINGDAELNDTNYNENNLIIVNGCLLIRRIDNDKPIDIIANGMVAYDKRTKINPIHVNGNCCEIPFDDYEFKSFGNLAYLNNQFFESISKNTVICCGNKIKMDADVELDTLKSKNILLIAGNKILCSKEIIGYVNLIGKVGNKIESYETEKNK